MNDDKRKRPRPSPDPPDESSTAEQLRADIDRGDNQDKVDFPDPAAAPLGTDSEAAGTPTPPEGLAAERLRNRRPQRDEPRGAPRLNLWLLSLIIAALILAGAAVLLAV